MQNVSSLSFRFLLLFFYFFIFYFFSPLTHLPDMIHNFFPPPFSRCSGVGGEGGYLTALSSGGALLPSTRLYGLSS